MRILANTFKEDLNIFLKNYALWICIGIVAIIAITVIVILIRNKKSKVVDNTPKLADDEWLNALGGKDNIIEVTAMGSRLNVSLKNKDTIDREKLTQLGVSNIMMMSSKATLIIEDKAVATADKINKLLK